ncbi:MAG: M48 family metalloprotease, partial [Bacteroidota bacterium]|nr:M48 family metalloprotease [Bacteroidota bacterium]
MRIKRYFVYSFFVLFSLSFYSCDNGINIFSTADDASLGSQLNAQVEGDSKEYPIYHGNPAIKNYIVDRIFNHILASSQIQYKNVFSYKLEIIDNDNTLNAFCLPGGYIYVYTGLLKYLNSEAALAGVVAHEIAHAERRHSTKRMTAQYGVAILVNIILGNNPSELEQIAANLLVGIGFLANSRSDENEADQYSFNFLKDTRYYQGGVKFFFEKMRADGLISSQSNKIATFLSTHPDPISRI